MVKKDKIVLDLCGGTGAWSEPYRKAGYTVHVITLPHYLVGHSHHDEKTLTFVGLQGAPNIQIELANVYGILAAPPCTQFSFARQRYKTPPNFKEAMQTVQACLEIVYLCQTYGRLTFWALENPTGHLRRFIGKPPLRFLQWQYGGHYEKPTDLWGSYEMPTPTTRKRPASLTQEVVNKRWSNPPIPDSVRAQYRTTSERRAAVRAITPAGFAKAFYAKNR